MNKVLWSVLLMILLVGISGGGWCQPLEDDTIEKWIENLNHEDVNIRRNIVHISDIVDGLKLTGAVPIMVQSLKQLNLNSSKDREELRRLVLQIRRELDVKLEKPAVEQAEEQQSPNQANQEAEVEDLVKRGEEFLKLGYESVKINYSMIERLSLLGLGEVYELFGDRRRALEYLVKSVEIESPLQYDRPPIA